MDTIEFTKFPKIARFSRKVIMTEKIDGTNVCVYNGADDIFLTGSRNRWITPEDDHYGFSKWAHEHRDELRALGHGLHRGEWWGGDIQRGYGLKKDDRRFSMFNVTRWCLHGETPSLIPQDDPRIEKYQDVLPPCVGLVPVLWAGNMDKIGIVDVILDWLAKHGSFAVRGYAKPEGIVIYHTAANVCFKKTLVDDDVPKSKAKRRKEANV
jgi:hypothetical protein